MVVWWNFKVLRISNLFHGVTPSMSNSTESSWTEFIQMTSVSTSCINDSYVDFADAEKSLNVANETEIVTKSLLRWIQKEPKVRQGQQVCYARRPVHDLNSTSSLICQRIRQSLLYPVKKMPIQQNGKVFSTLKPTESADMTQNVSRKDSFRVQLILRLNLSILTAACSGSSVFSRFWITYSDKPLKLTRPDGIAFNLQNPNVSVPDVRLSRVTHRNTHKYTESYAQDPLGDKHKFTCQRIGPISSQSSEEKTALSHASRAANMKQITTDYYQSHLQISQDSSLPVLNQKAYSDLPLTPPLSLSGQPSPNHQCYDIESHQNASPFLSMQSSYPFTINPPTENYTKENYTALLNIIATTSSTHRQCPYSDDRKHILEVEIEHSVCRGICSYGNIGIFVHSTSEHDIQLFGQINANTMDIFEQC
ncbi:hypothetical protein KIN20_010009 [Parelaphostrongylus tenuis]|uniref:Uncharacterized protein n=1 Tax=Parelaphostrongylus tenuis TaxID=148309 RepID=A0AAD5MAJ9_PARTN|nr:hypothetical protein KIN20_010009 [Parelaphostrongylus tenuis]